MITLDTPLLNCDFSLTKNLKLFSAVTGVSQFQFNADMATAWRKVKRDNDIKFMIPDMIYIYYGKSDDAKYDNWVVNGINF